MIQALILLLLLFVSNDAATETSDPLAAEIALWKEFIETNTAVDEDWKAIRGMTEPLLSKADKAVRENRRLYALHLLSAARSNLAAQKFVSERPAGIREQVTAFEEEWKKIGALLTPVLLGQEHPRFDGLSAAARAVGESSLSQIKPYYEASLEYGRNTLPDAGLFYLGSAKAQWEFARYCAANLRQDSPEEQPALSGILTEIDAFEGKLLSEYKPPASVDHHPVFIRASATVKQTRELHDAGMLHGALYKYLEARLQLSKVKSVGNPMSVDDIARRAAEFEKRLQASRTDHSIGRLFVEMALIEGADTSSGSTGGQTARAIFDDVLPHYFAAVESQKRQRMKPKPEVTVTLVRWPYT